jgi:hypothetical protein
LYVSSFLGVELCGIWSDFRLSAFPFLLAFFTTTFNYLPHPFHAMVFLQFSHFTLRRSFVSTGDFARVWQAGESTP